MTLPAALLKAIAAEGGGQVVLVIGAGTSHEQPMEVPMSRQCSCDAHVELLADGVLQPDECPDPEDLSVLADTVYEKEQKQKPLVERMPLGKFRNALPNEGCLLAAALLREGAVDSVITLNFDRGMQTALANLGTNEDVAIVHGPEEHDRLSGANLIYLHRSVDADPEDWILRTVSLEKEWKGGWEEAIVQRLLGVPVTVFAGLGTAAGVLVAATDRLRKIVPDTANIYLVDPGKCAESEFAASLDLQEDSYLQFGWCEFMLDLAQRLVGRFVKELDANCRALVAQEEWSDPDPKGLCERFGELSLLQFGKVRARWLLDKSPYRPDGTVESGLLADLLLAVGFIEQATDSEAVFYEDGVVAFRRDEDLVTSAVFASGGGSLSWEAMEAAAAGDRFRQARPIHEPRFAIFAAAREGRPADAATPEDVIGDPIEDNVASAELKLEAYSVSQLRECDEVVERMAA
jgi:hypothetical protein